MNAYLICLELLRCDVEIPGVVVLWILLVQRIRLMVLCSFVTLLFPRLFLEPEECRMDGHVHRSLEI